MKKTGLMAVIFAGMIIGLWGASGSWAQMNIAGTYDNEMMANQVIHDEGYGNADAEYYGSKDDLVNDDLTNDQK